MADPLDYTLVRIDDNIQDGAVLTYDAVNDKITDSGMTSSQGDLRASAGTISVGLQDMSSAGEQVIWRNQDSQINYAPPWHILDEVNTEGSRDRVYEPIQTVTRFATRTDILEDPTFAVTIVENEVVFKLNMTFPEAHEDVEFKVTHSGFEMWREIIDVSAGQQEITLKMPIAFYPGTYIFSISHYGDSSLHPPVKVMGDSVTGEVGYDVTYRGFREIPLATQEYVTEEIAKIPSSGGTGTGDMEKVVYDTNNNGIVDNAEKVNGIDTATNSQYYGVDSDGNHGFHNLPVSTGGMPSTSQGRTVVRSIVKYIQTPWDASSGQFPATSKKGNLYKAGSTGTIDGQLFEKDDYLLALQNSGSRTVYTGNWLRIVGKTYVHSIAGREGVIDSEVLKEILEDLGVKYMHELTTYTVYVGTALHPLATSSELKDMTNIEVNNPHFTYSISQDGSLARYIFIAMPTALANKVVGFRMKDGPISHWNSYVVAINGPSDYTVYRSPFPLINSNIDIISEI